jgi:aminocarboxymuconate-semialdehyde decarboxylase
MKKVDLHSHVLPDTVLDLMEKATDADLYKAKIVRKDGKRFYSRGKNQFELDPEYYSGEGKVAKMDRMKIDISYISTGPQAFCYWQKEEDAVKTARAVNEGIAKMVAERPDRLRGMASVPMQHPDLAIAELEHAVKTYGFKGVEIATSIVGEELAAQKFRPFLKRCQDLKVSVFTHPENIGATGRLDCYYMTNLIGNPLDTTIMVANLMFSGALDELKELKFLLPHAGGFTVADIGRFQWGHGCRPDTSVDCKTPPMELLRRFWFDALAHNPKAVRFLIEQVGADRVVVGTDDPFDMGDMTPIDNIEKVPGLTDAERELIYWKNAEAFMGGPV